MKSFRLFIYIFILITAFSVYGFSQVTASKTAVIDSDVFKNKQRGIKEVVEAYDKLDAEFKPQNDELNLIAEKAKKIVVEVKEHEIRMKKFPKLGCPPSIEEKIEEFRKLQTEYKEKDDKRKLLYDTRKAEIFVEIDKKIFAALQQFAKENNIETILDDKGMEERPSLASVGDDKLIVTDEFIAFYNKKQAETRP